MATRLNILSPLTNEQVSMDELIKIQNENDAFKTQIKSLQLTIETYQDENGKVILEKDELIKQISDLREKSEETASKVFLKSEAMTNFKQELNRLTEDNINYKNELNDLQRKFKEYQTENNELKEKNIKYEKSLNESRLNEDILTQKLSKQSVELLELKSILQEFQTKYDHLFIENSCFQQENEQLKDTADEIKLITRTNNGNEPSATSIKWRYKKTITNANMEECLNELHFEHKPSITITPSSYKHGTNMSMTNGATFNIITPITPKQIQNYNITPKSIKGNTMLTSPFVYNFECTDLIHPGLSPQGQGHNPFIPPNPSSLPLLNVSSGFDEIEESPVESLRTMEEHESISIGDDNDNCDNDNDDMIREWRKKCEDLKAENDSLRKLCDEYRNNQQQETKKKKIKEMEDKARAYDLKTDRYGGCNGYLVFNCFPNKGGIKEDQ